MPDVQYPDDPMSHASAIRIEDLLAGDEDAPAAPAGPVREGLPRTFRMRADKHYVEMLDAPAPGASPDPAPAAAGVAAPDTEGDRRAAAARDVGRDLARSLAALMSSAGLLSDRGPALASTVAVNLVRAEAWRATCLLRLSRFLRGEIALSAKPVRARTVLEQLLAGIEPERRLRGITMHERMNAGDRIVSADEELLVAALSGWLMATIALAEDASPLTVTLSAEARGNEVVFGISQDQTAPPPHWAAAGPACGAAAIVTASKGRVTVADIPSGTDVRIALPRVP